MKSEISSATSQIKLRGALALVLVFTVLANSLGVEMILGAFLAGVIIREAWVADLLRQAGAERTRTLVALEERDEDNLLVCKIAKSVFGVPNMIAWMQDTTNEGAFSEMGARIVNPSRATLLLIEAMAVNPDYYRMVRELDSSIDIREVKLKQSPLVGKHIEEVTLPEDVTVIGISRSGELMVPDNRTQLRANDTLTLVGSTTGIDETLKRLRIGVS